MGLIFIKVRNNKLIYKNKNKIKIHPSPLKFKSKDLKNET
jgi:hypothetical protein